MHHDQEFSQATRDSPSSGETPQQRNDAWRFRFSLGSLLLAVTVFGACLSWFRLRTQLMRSEPLMELLSGTMGAFPVGLEVLLLVCQLATLTLTIALLIGKRATSLLWLSVAAHGIWLAVVVIVTVSSGEHVGRWVQDAILAVLFFEPAFFLIVAVVGWFQVLLRRKPGPRLLMTALVILSLLAEIVAIVSLDTWGRALQGALMSGG